MQNYIPFDFLPHVDVLEDITMLHDALLQLSAGNNESEENEKLTDNQLSYCRLIQCCILSFIHM